MTVRIITSSGANLASSSGAYIIHSGEDVVVGTGARSTLMGASIRRDLYEYRCPSCNTITMRDGRRGARNLLHACSKGCFSKARQIMVSRNMQCHYTGVWRHAPANREGTE